MASGKGNGRPQGRAGPAESKSTIPSDEKSTSTSPSIPRRADVRRTLTRARRVLAAAAGDDTRVTVELLTAAELVCETGTRRRGS